MVGYDNFLFEDHEKKGNNMATQKHTPKKGAKKSTRKVSDSVTKRTAKAKIALLEALRKNLGIVSRACEQAKLNRCQFYKWVRDDSEFRAQVEDVEQIALDFVESQHYKLIKKGNPASVIFHLKTKGKSRGYIEKTEIEHSGGLELDVTRLTDLELTAIIASKE